MPMPASGMDVQIAEQLAASACKARYLYRYVGSESVSPNNCWIKHDKRPFAVRRQFFKDNVHTCQLLVSSQTGREGEAEHPIPYAIVVQRGLCI